MELEFEPTSNVLLGIRLKERRKEGIPITSQYRYFPFHQCFLAAR